MTEPNEKLIHVLLVDDHAVVRKGMRALLDREPGIEVVGEADNGDQAAHAAERLRPDVILMDLEMPGTGGIDATRQITAQHHDMRIVVLTSHAAEEDVFPALKAGAQGYLLKHSAPEEVLQAIRQAHPRRDGFAPRDRAHGTPGIEPASTAKAGENLRTAVRARDGGLAVIGARDE